MAGAGGTSFAASKLGKGKEPREIFGLPAEVAAGVALYALGLTGAGGPALTDHVLNLADGALAAFACKQAAHFAGGAVISGEPPYGYIGASPSGNPATDALLQQAGLLPGYYG